VSSPLQLPCSSDDRLVPPPSRFTSSAPQE
jgi:hypothetical protein